MRALRSLCALVAKCRRRMVLLVSWLWCAERKRDEVRACDPLGARLRTCDALRTCHAGRANLEVDRMASACGIKESALC